MSWIDKELESDKKRHTFKHSIDWIITTNIDIKDRHTSNFLLIILSVIFTYTHLRGPHPLSLPMTLSLPFLEPLSTPLCPDSSPLAYKKCTPWLQASTVYAWMMKLIEYLQMRIIYWSPLLQTWRFNSLTWELFLSDSCTNVLPKNWAHESLLIQTIVYKRELSQETAISFLSFRAHCVIVLPFDLLSPIL